MYIDGHLEEEEEEEEVRPSVRPPKSLTLVTDGSRTHLKTGTLLTAIFAVRVKQKETLPARKSSNALWRTVRLSVDNVALWDKTRSF